MGILYIPYTKNIEDNYKASMINPIRVNNIITSSEVPCKDILNNYDMISIWGLNNSDTSSKYHQVENGDLIVFSEYVNESCYKLKSCGRIIAKCESSIISQRIWGSDNYPYILFIDDLRETRIVLTPSDIEDVYLKTKVKLGKGEAIDFSAKLKGFHRPPNYCTPDKSNMCYLMYYAIKDKLT